MSGDAGDQPFNYVFAPLAYDFQVGGSRPVRSFDDTDLAVRSREPPSPTPLRGLSVAEESGYRAAVDPSSRGGRRFESFYPLLRRWFDLDDDQLRAVLVRLEGGASWIDAPFPGVRYFRFQAGPGAAARQAGCLLLTPGALFPHHLHHGRERSLILAGSLLLDGIVRVAGQVIEAPAGSMHDFVAGPREDLILIVGHDGVSFSV